MEPHATLAHWDAAGNVHDLDARPRPSSTSATRSRAMFKIPISKVRVIGDRDRRRLRRQVRRAWRRSRSLLSAQGPAPGQVGADAAPRTWSARRRRRTR